MTTILDSHVLLWLINGGAELGRRARELCESAHQDDPIGVSAVSFYELADAHRKGRLAMSPDPWQWRAQVLNFGIIEVPVDAGIAMEASALIDFHRDPMDRLIAATALRHAATLVTADNAILRWAGPLRSVDAKL
jgi:PIN domain nuclease of toxin-antitoxin system